MPTLPVVVLVVVSLLVLAALLTTTVRTLRGFRRTLSMVMTGSRDRAGLLRARSAALRVAVEQRRLASRNK